MRASGISNKIKDKEIFCSYLNSKMNFTGFGLSLTPETISFDHEKREFSKLALNSFLGKFSQKFDQPIQKVVSTEEEISKNFYSKTFQITDIFALNNFFCQIEVKKTKISY